MFLGNLHEYEIGEYKMMQDANFGWKITEYQIPQILDITILRKQLLNLYPNSALFETSPGFQDIDGDDTTFMLDLLFEITFINGEWKIDGKFPFNKHTKFVYDILNSNDFELCSSFRKITKFLQIPDSFPMVFMLSHSAARFFENIPNMKIHDSEPEVVFRIYKNIISIDKELNLALVKSLCYNENDIDNSKNLIQYIKEKHSIPICLKKENVELKDITKREQFIQAVNSAKQYIKDGEIYQVLLCRTSLSKSNINPIILYENLSLVNPSPYQYYIDLNNQHVISSSPELMLRIKNNVAQVRPIAGTMSKEDNRKTPLNKINKESAEHLMLVDLARNDLARCSENGGVQVTNLMNIESYGSINHLVSTIQTEIKKNFDIWDLIRSNFPAGTMTGAPKIRAIELINKLEDSPRGLYSGFGGYFNSKGDGVFALTIRTIIGSPGNYKLCAGAGIVADSIPTAEWDETSTKLKSFAKAINPKSCEMSETI